jgi:hypothetical protein
MGSGAWFENLGGDTEVRERERERERVALMCTGEIVAI